MICTFVRLTPALLDRHISILIEMDRGTAGEAWQKSHFRADLPDKWIASRLALDEKGEPVGFLIASRKDKIFHVHRIVVASRVRGCGVGAELLRSLAEHAQLVSIPSITLKVAKSNSGAIRFYLRLGFEQRDAGPVNLTLSVRPVDLLSIKMV